MENRWWSRSGALAGIVFVVLEIASIPAGGGKPRAGEAIANSISYYGHHRGAIMVSALLASLAAVAFLWFVAYLADVAAKRGRVTGLLRQAILASGIGVGTVAAIAILPQVALAAIVNRPGQHLDESFVRGTLAMSSAVYGPLTLLTALFAAVLAAFALTGGLRMRWVGWLAGLAAVASLVGGCLAFFADVNGKQSPGGVIGLIGSLVMFLSVLIVSFDLLTGAPVANNQPG